MLIKKFINKVIKESINTNEQYVYKLFELWIKKFFDSANEKYNEIVFKNRQKIIGNYKTFLWLGGYEELYEETSSKEEKENIIEEFDELAELITVEKIEKFFIRKILNDKYLAISIKFDDDEKHTPNLFYNCL